MQTPSITAGKTVIDTKRAGRKGTVQAVTGDKARVDWGGVRIKPVKLEYLQALPVPDASHVCRPTADGQRVIINGGEHAHQQGIISRFNM